MRSFRIVVEIRILNEKVFIFIFFKYIKYYKDVVTKKKEKKYTIKMWCKTQVLPFLIPTYHIILSPVKE